MAELGQTQNVESAWSPGASCGYIIMVRRIFVDTEWTAAPWEGHACLMWIGLADEEGRSWYGISSEVEIDPITNPFVAGAFSLIDRHEPRVSRGELADAVVRFCGNVDEFWAWVPTLESFSAFSRLTDGAIDAYRRWWDVDLQMLRGLISPWPATWPTILNDLNRTAMAAGVQIPERAPNHLHPKVHAEWNRELLRRIHAAQSRNN